VWEEEKRKILLYLQFITQGLRRTGCVLFAARTVNLPVMMLKWHFLRNQFLLAFSRNIYKILVK